MARRNDPNDDIAQKQQRKRQEQELEQENEKKASEKSDNDKGLTSQNQYGNQALAAILGGGGGGMPGVGGMSVEPSVRAAEIEAETEIQYGGDDDGVEDGPLTLEDLTRSWNPKTRKSEEHLRFIESMPDDDLPPEDPDYLEQVRNWTNTYSIPDSWTIDGLLEPSVVVVSSSLAKWSKSVLHWTDHSLLHRSIAHMIAPSAPFLQDDAGRVLPARARTAAIATWLLLQSPSLKENNRVENATLIDYCMELDGRDFRLHNVLKYIEESEEKLPKARSIVLYHCADSKDQVSPKTLEPASRISVIRSINAIMRFINPISLVPNLEREPKLPDDSDDPLGLDAVLNAHTGEVPEPESASYKDAIQAAEKLAGAAATTRSRMAAACILISEVSEQWSKGSPIYTLLHVADHLDNKVDEVLGLLVEIARAAKGKTVPPKGLQNGLLRAAKAINSLRESVADLLSQVVGGILPGGPAVHPPRQLPDDPLESAWRDGQPLLALPWLQSLPENPVRDAVILFTRAGAGESCDELLQDFEALHKLIPIQAGWLQSITAICLGVCYLRCNNLDAAIALASNQIGVGFHRKNGMVIAQATLQIMEAHMRAGRPQDANHIRCDMGRLLWSMGARGPLTLLARWSPMPDQEDAAA